MCVDKQTPCNQSPTRGEPASAEDVGTTGDRNKGRREPASVADVSKQDGGLQGNGGRRTLSVDVPAKPATRETGQLSQPQPKHQEEGVSPNFNDLRKFCENSRGKYTPVDARPQVVVAHRQAHWPDMVDVTGKGDLVQIYRAVKATGLPNAIGARIPVPSKLNIQAWEQYLRVPLMPQRPEFCQVWLPYRLLGPGIGHRVHPQPPQRFRIPWTCRGIY